MAQSVTQSAYRNLGFAVWMVWWTVVQSGFKVQMYLLDRLPMRSRGWLLYWHALLTTNEISGLVIVAYCNASITDFYNLVTWEIITAMFAKSGGGGDRCVDAFGRSFKANLQILITDSRNKWPFCLKFLIHRLNYTFVICIISSCLILVLIIIFYTFGPTIFSMININEALV